MDADANAIRAVAVRDIPIAAAPVLVLLILGIPWWRHDASEGRVGRPAGILLLAYYAVYLALVVLSAVN